MKWRWPRNTPAISGFCAQKFANSVGVALSLPLEMESPPAKKFDYT
jgi:hypothetical protein